MKPRTQTGPRTVWPLHKTQKTKRQRKEEDWIRKQEARRDEGRFFYRYVKETVKPEENIARYMAPYERIVSHRFAKVLDGDLWLRSTHLGADTNPNLWTKAKNASKERLYSEIKSLGSYMEQNQILPEDDARELLDLLFAHLEKRL